jgi:phosphoglycolate phosphatase-like HAD superfamily hydrolase
MTIFFDLDGPILDVSNRLYKLYIDLLKTYDCEVLSKEAYWELKRNKVPEESIVKRTCNFNIFDEYNKKRLELIETIDYLQLDNVVDGADKALEELKIKNKVILVTNRKHFDKLCWELKYFNLEKHFDAILAAPGNREPWNIKVQLILKNKFELKSSFIVGDTEADIIAGKLLNINTIAVLNGIRSKSMIESLMPDHICDSIVGAALKIKQLSSNQVPFHN